MRKIKLPSKKFKCAIYTILCLAFWTHCQAYTVEISTNSALEQQFLTATEQEFSVVVTSNPFFANTYQINLLGQNPNFNPPVTNLELLQDIVTVDSTTYLYGFADGQTYQQTLEEGLVGAMGNLCGYATNYNLVQTSSVTFNKSTCQDVIGTIENCLFQQSTGVPTVIPPEP